MTFGKGSEMDLMVKPLVGAKGQRALEAGVAGLTGNEGWSGQLVALAVYSWSG